MYVAVYKRMLVLEIEFHAFFEKCSPSTGDMAQQQNNFFRAQYYGCVRHKQSLCIVYSKCVSKCMHTGGRTFQDWNRLFIMPRYC